MYRTVSACLLCVLGFGACTPYDPLLVVLTPNLDRVAAEGPDPVTVRVEVLYEGEPQTEADVQISTSNGRVGPITHEGDGVYTAQVTHTLVSGLIKLDITALGVTVTRTAIVMPTLAAHWGQPELVEGLVNTPGHEDSVEVSPDGQWLVVSTYSPIDLLCCLFGVPLVCPSGPTADPASPVCNVSLGAYDEPQRPLMPGAERILSNTQIHDTLPSLGITAADGGDLPFAVPPVGAYGFHRQSDGSFAEPFVIAFDADGMPVAPFGFNFVPGSTGGATVLFAWDDVRTDGSDPANTGNDLYRMSLGLGSPNILGTFTSSAPGTTQLDTELDPVPLASADLALPSGNPGYASDGVFYDAEDGEHDLYFAAGDALGPAPLAPAVTVDISSPSQGEYQPFVHQDRLFYARDFAELISVRRGTGAVSDPATWSDSTVELGVGAQTSVGSLLTIGEPSIATVGGSEELYFGFGVRKLNGIDQAVGRVKRR